MEDKIILANQYFQKKNSTTFPGLLFPAGLLAPKPFFLLLI